MPRTPFSIRYFDRATRSFAQEKVYQEKWVYLLYSNSFLSKSIGRLFLLLSAYVPLVSKLYGWVQSLPITRKKIAPFVEEFDLDPEEFEQPIEQFNSFNDFFSRRLKQSARPFDASPYRAIAPADGRYLCFTNIARHALVPVKGQTLSLDALVGDRELAKSYMGGSLVLIRLCPTDYHRFHFPCDGIASNSKLIQGPLFSVNPLALCQRSGILSSNRRMISYFTTKPFGKVIYIEIGATHCGSIQQTYTPGRQLKGGEKGYFAFGGSALILLFLPGAICFDPDLIEHSLQYCEVRLLLGHSLGKASCESWL